MARRNLITSLSLLALAASAIWVVPDTSAPIPRLLANAQKAEKASPKDAYPVYLQARLHSLAFARATQEAKVYEKYADKKPFSFPSYETLKVRRGGGPLKPEELKHLRQSLELYQKATRMAPNEPIYALGRAWMHEEGAPFAKKLGTLPWLSAEPLTEKAMLAEAIRSYREIVRRFDAQESQTPGTLMGVPDAYATEEAALRLVAHLRKAQMSPAEKAEVARMEALAAEYAKKKQGITPVIVPLDRTATLGELIDDFARVRFDLDGDGQAEAGPWVTPRAGILVWDPALIGKITSGRQLFGNAMFWMMFPDGYRALASLDDDRNGWLEGRELAGIAVWRDEAPPSSFKGGGAGGGGPRGTSSTGNGISEPGEVRPLSHWGIRALRVTPSGKESGMLTAEHGVRWSDRTTSPSWDWVVAR